MKQAQVSAKSKKALIASLIGSTIEYYDYLLYGTIASLVFNKIFFPNFDPTVGLLLSYASFGIPFICRPLGGVFFSHIGDRVGRKNTLVVTLALMGISTVLIGFLPDYNTIGIWAPILLITLRMIQGIGIGGEWGGALLLAVEYSPEEKKGFAGSVPMMGASLGMLLGTLTVSIMTLLPEDQFLSWGWRVPFVLSILLVWVGLWIRKGLGETPAFEEAKKTGNIAKMPIVETFRKHWKSVLLTIGVKLMDSGPFYFFATFIIAYATQYLGMDKVSVLNAITIGTLCATFVIPITGMLSDRYGRKPLFIIGTVGMMLFAFPYFYLLSFKTFFWLTVATGIAMSFWAMITAVIGTLFSEMFSTNVRYTGITVGYQMGSAVAGGTTPLIAASLISAFQGSWVPVAFYLIGMGVISLVCCLLAKTVGDKESAMDKVAVNPPREKRINSL